MEPTADGGLEDDATAGIELQHLLHRELHLGLVRGKERVRWVGWAEMLTLAVSSFRCVDMVATGRGWMFGPKFRS